MPPKRTTSSIASFGRGAKATTSAAVAQAGKAAGKTAAKGGKPVVEAKDLKRSPSVSSTKENPPAPELVKQAEGKEELDVDDPGYNDIWEATQEKMGMPRMQPIHSEGHNRVMHILRAFDLDPSYGPAVGMTRLERWNRAKNLGEDPPEEIRHILETKEGILKDELRESVLRFAGSGTI